MSEPADIHQLVADCLKGNRRAQERFYRTYAPAALPICRKYATDRTEATELLNHGMLRVFEKLGHFRWEGSLEGFVKRLVFRATVDQFRRRRKRPTLEIADWDAPADNPATHALYAEDLCHMIDLLPTATREVFWRFAVEGYSHREIAIQLGFSEGNSRWHLNKARQILKERLAQPSHQDNRYAG